MRTLRTVGGIALALLLSLSGFAVTEASPYLVIKKAAYYEVPDYSGFPADIVKDILKAEGVKPKFESTTGGRARATQDWLVVKTEPAIGKKIKLGKRKPKVTVIVRKVDETATGITGKAAAKECEDHADSEFRFGAEIVGNWKVSATDEVSRIKARIDVGNTFGREIRMTCEVVKGRKGDLEVKDFEVIGIDYEPAQ